MIIARSPLRISLGGGGTDLPSYYRSHEGFLISAAIDKYVYVTINRPFIEGIFLKYSFLEDVKQVDEVNGVFEALESESHLILVTSEKMKESLFSKLRQDNQFNKEGDTAVKGDDFKF